MRATGDAEVAADLTAETIASALVARSSYRPEKAAPATCLYGIARHKLSDWRRRGYAEDRARQRLRMERIELSDDDVQELEHLAAEVTVTELVEELPDDQRGALQARVVDERAYGKIAGPNPGAPGPKKEILVYGRAPEGASAVRVTADEGVWIEAAL